MTFTYNKCRSQCAFDWPAADSIRPGRSAGKTTGGASSNKKLKVCNLEILLLKRKKALKKKEKEKKERKKT